MVAITEGATMDQRRDTIDPDIRVARTPAPAFYTDPSRHALQLERIFARAWHPVPDAARALPAEHVHPFVLLPGGLDEPLVVARDAGGVLRCLSNVCTHRGNLVATCAGPARVLRCGYHGRRFALDGRMLSMPEFEGVRDFPSPADDLRSLPLETWGPLSFTSLDPGVSFGDWIGPVASRLAGLSLGDLRLDPRTSKDYELRANWALYCDNYLEGFHIPYVHEGLAEALDYGAYRTELHEHGSVQIGIARGEDESVFELPARHPDAGERIAAYYFWLFPNLMLNFYPWGLSLNIVEPCGPDRTRVRFLSYVGDPRLREVGAGADLHRVEMEDEAIVENVQRGLASRLYRGGRYSPSRESGVHHFHRLLARVAGESEPR